MSLHDVRYWTVECDEPGCEYTLGTDSDYSAWADKSAAVEDWCEAGWGVVMPDGKTAYCGQHIPDEFCPDDDEHKHDWEPWYDGEICGNCSREREKK